LAPRAETNQYTPRRAQATITTILDACMSFGHVRPIEGDPLERHPPASWKTLRAAAPVPTGPGTRPWDRRRYASFEVDRTQRAREDRGRSRGRLEMKKGHSEEQAAVARRFGTNVKRLREARRLSRDELASLSGISADSIYRIETARRLVKISTWFRLAGGLGAEPGELTEGIEWSPPRDGRRSRSRSSADAA
jgi:ribosome-binding protein aMBF1 (putative translation factor)